ncbi:MAG: amidase family protein [Hyphomonas sp.]|uniref:amidase family protein n=1 Tax=Hyphomonas sp. UBA5107 TaxID=1946636 RepID=UPI000C64C36E|nr:amidase family protein [Hyphomonas sp. UBA5107]MAA82014.1 6-aminohexanoate hydrolase [Hyphomonas sp.]HBL94730.1 6-aminohexanoate hydrolase [Hyphomonas sp.]|tara:strand:- start:64 stop:1578 length:1515 start_codon:yes stop_codon:yes gene_type:complete
MTGFSRREALLGGAAIATLAACGQTPSDAAATVPTGPVAAKAVPPAGWESGLTIAARIASGETTSLAETEKAIARAKAVNGDLNAIATDSFDQALRDAAVPAPGTFSGVPTFMKDLVGWKGTQSMWGSRAFVGNISQEDSPFAAAWRKGGVVSLGKSTTPEMGLISSTEPLVTGPTRNPWDLSRIPGGSSGGAAALVAARVVPFAHASDGGGSIRIPASTCGVFGLKPSRARLDKRDAANAPPVDISVNHAVTITVQDSIELFRVAETNDGTYAPLGDISPLNRPLRIGFAPDSISGTRVSPETTAALEDVAQLCRDLGHEVIDFKVPLDGKEFTDKFLLYWAAGAAEFAQQASAYSGKPIGPDIVEPWTLGLAAMFQARQSEMEDTIAYLKAFEAVYDDWFSDMDVLLTPVTGSPAVPIGEQAPDGDFDAVMESVLNFAAFTAPMNVAGAASMSVPLSWSSGGLPIGSMFSAKRGEDGLLFELAMQLEMTRPWIARTPPVSAL